MKSDVVFWIVLLCVALSVASLVATWRGKQAGRSPHWLCMGDFMFNVSCWLLIVGTVWWIFA